MKLSAVACQVGVGLFAGLVGTVAITAAQAIEMRLRGRKPSNSPAKAMEKVLGVVPQDAAAETRLTTLVHWSYGTAWGVPRALLAMAGVRPMTATLLHAAALEGTALTALPALGVAPPASQWGLTEIAIEGGHHLVYAIAAGATYQALSRGTRPEPPASRRMALLGAAALGLQWWLARGHRLPPSATPTQRLRFAVREARHGHYWRALGALGPVGAARRARVKAEV